MILPQRTGTKNARPAMRAAKRAAAKAKSMANRKEK